MGAHRSTHSRRHRQRTASKWIRILVGSALAVFGATGLVVSIRSGLAQELYFRYKYGHLVGTRWEVPPFVPTNLVEKAEVVPERLPELLQACERANRLCPENWYFPSFTAHQALWVALTDDDPVEFRRHFGQAEHWCRIGRGINPYDIELAYIWCRILWEKGERDEAIRFWRDDVLARQFWNPVIRQELIRLCRMSGDYSIARQEARYLIGGTKTVRSLEAIQNNRRAIVEDP